MTIRLAMYEGSLAHIRPQLEALGLDLEILPITREGWVVVGGVETPPEVAEADYLWLSTHIHADGVAGKIFDAAGRFGRIDVLQTHNAGLDNPVYRRVSENGARVCNSSAQGVAIAEHVFAQTMSVLQPIEEQRRLQAAGEWKATPFREIAGMNWLIVGYGPIGRETAKRACAFDAHVSVIRRRAAADEHVDRVGTLADLNGFAAEADLILLACPLKDETRGLAGAELFAAVKPGAILVNVARGGVVDDAALLAALDDGRVGAAILDVFNEEPLPAGHPYWMHPKVRMTAHMSNAGSGGRGRWDALFLDNLRRYAAGEPLVNEVDPADI